MIMSVKSLDSLLIPVLIMALAWSVVAQEGGELEPLKAEGVQHAGGNVTQGQVEGQQKEAGQGKVEGQDQDEAKPTVAHNNCTDARAACRKWADLGECRINPHYMVNLCQASCRTCPKHLHNCSDNVPNCSILASLNDCDINIDWMRENCFRACGYCNNGTKTPLIIEETPKDVALSNITTTVKKAMAGNLTTPSPRNLTLPESSANTTVASTTKAITTPLPNTTITSTIVATSTTLANATMSSTTMGSTTTLLNTTVGSTTVESTTTLPNTTVASTTTLPNTTLANTTMASATTLPNTTVANITTLPNTTVVSTSMETTTILPNTTVARSTVTNTTTLPNTTVASTSVETTTILPNTTVARTTIRSTTTLSNTTGASTSMETTTTLPNTTVANTTMASTTTLPNTTVANTTMASTTTLPNTTVANTTMASTTTLPNTTVASTTVASTTTLPNTTVESTTVASTTTLPNTTVANTTIASTTTLPNTTVASTTVASTTTLPNTTVASTTVASTTPLPNTTVASKTVASTTMASTTTLPNTTVASSTIASTTPLPNTTVASTTMASTTPLPNTTMASTTPLPNTTVASTTVASTTMASTTPLPNTTAASTTIASTTPFPNTTVASTTVASTTMASTTPLPNTTVASTTVASTTMASITMTSTTILPNTTVTSTAMESTTPLPNTTVTSTTMASTTPLPNTTVESTTVASTTVAMTTILPNTTMASTPMESTTQLPNTTVASATVASTTQLPNTTVASATVASTTVARTTILPNTTVASTPMESTTTLPNTTVASTTVASTRTLSNTTVASTATVANTTTLPNTTVASNITSPNTTIANTTMASTTTLPNTTVASTTIASTTTLINTTMASATVPNTTTLPNTTVVLTTIASITTLFNTTLASATVVSTTTMPNTTIASMITLPNTTVTSTTAATPTTLLNIPVTNRTVASTTLPNTTVASTTIASTTTLPNTTVESTTLPNTTVASTTITSTTRFTNKTVASATMLPNTTAEISTLPNTTDAGTTRASTTQLSNKTIASTTVTITTALFNTTVASPTPSLNATATNMTTSTSVASTTLESTPTVPIKTLADTTTSSTTVSSTITSQSTTRPSSVSTASSEIITFPNTSSTPASTTTYMTTKATQQNRTTTAASTLSTETIKPSLNLTSPQMKTTDVAITATSVTTEEHPSKPVSRTVASGSTLEITTPIALLNVTSTTMGSSPDLISSTTTTTLKNVSTEATISLSTEQTTMSPSSTTEMVVITNLTKQVDSTSVIPTTTKPISKVTTTLPITDTASSFPSKQNTTVGPTLSPTSPTATGSSIITVLLTTSTAPDACTNAWGDDKCNVWLDMGECKNNPGWMKKNCYKACGYCECVDDPEYQDCIGWAQDGQCAINVDWMTKHCKRSCGKCPVLTTTTMATTTMATTTTATTTTTMATTPVVQTSTTSSTPAVSTTVPTTTPTTTKLVTSTTPEPIVETTEGALFSNETHILSYNGLDLKVIVAQEKGSIVGVAVDVQNGYVFWSDLAWSTRGIYRATLDGRDIIRLISTDIIEVNGLSVDYVSRNIYWTDSVRRRIEVADYDGNSRRQLVTTGLKAPRGIVAEPFSGYLFWGDQGTRTISRSRLDGSEQMTIVKENLIWPNQLAVFERQLLFVDGWNKTLTSVDFNGDNREVVANLVDISGDYPIFGLAVVRQAALVTSWGSGALLEVPLMAEGGAPRRVLEKLGRDVMFSIASMDPKSQPEGVNPCGRPDYGGCSHLCLPTGGLSYRCACPTWGGKVLRNNTCVVPEAVLLYADSDLGQVTFTDPKAPTDKYVVGSSPRPVAVGYDPVDQRVFWSDVRERSIHSVFLNGSGHVVLLNASQGLGFVDGLFVDWIHRKLYLTNADFVTIDGTAFTWHRIEVAELDGTGRRSIITDIEQPRGLWVDMYAGFIYFTDWGQDARVVRAKLDGTQQEVLLDGVENPNAVIVTNDSIYVIDSRAKSRESGSTSGDVAILYQRDLDSTEWSHVYTIALNTPYGLASDGNNLYISDWGRRAILSYDLKSGFTNIIASDITEPMGVFYSAVRIKPQADDLCSAAKCPSVCLTNATGSAQCACSTYDASVTASFGGCVEPENFLLVADLNEIRLVSQIPVDSHVYTVVRGNRYTASFSALVWDPWRVKFYFSDVNRRVIYQSDLSGRYSLLYQADDVIDGLVLEPSSSALYWTAQNEGAIYRLDLDMDGVDAVKIAQGLDKPKSLVFSPETSEVYWTEVGEIGTIKRISGGEGMNPPTTVWQSKIDKPENLFLDTQSSSIGFTVNGTIYSCSILATINATNKMMRTNDDCHNISSLPKETNPSPSMFLAGDYVYFSDWTRGAILRNSITDNSTSVPVVSGLMRPTNFVVVVRNRENDRCGSTHTCSDLCVSLPLDYACSCGTGRFLKPDGKRCSDLVVSTSTTLPTTTSTTEPTTTTTSVPPSSATTYRTTREATSSTSSVKPTPEVATSSTALPSTSKPSTSTPTPVVSTSQISPTTKTRLPTTQTSTTKTRETTTASTTPDTITRVKSTTTSTAAPSTKLPGPSTTTSDPTLPGPTFTGCPHNRTALLDRLSSVVEIWWLEPVAIDRTGSILNNVKSNLRPGALFSSGLSYVTYTAVDNDGKKTECTFFITVKREEFGCSGLPAPLNGDMMCGTEEFVATCQVMCRPGYVRNPAVTTVRPACRTTGWQPPFPPDYTSQSCLKQTDMKRMQPVTITYSGRCEESLLTGSFKQAFATKLMTKFRTAGLCPMLPESDSLGLCDPTSFQLQCETGMRLRKRRQVERIKVNITLSAPASNPDGDNAQRLRDTRANLERLLVLERLNVDLDGQSYIAQQVAPPEHSRVGCPPGQTISGKHCVLCPAGSSMVSGSCVSCPGGSYQPLPAAFDCFQCPIGTTSPQGAFSAELCLGLTTQVPTLASSTTANSLSVPIVIGLCVAAGIVFFITLALAVFTLRRLYKSKGEMTLDQEKAVLNGTSNGNGVQYANPAFVARPREETAGRNDPTPRYVAITKVPSGTDTMTIQKAGGIPIGLVQPGVPQQPMQYRRLPNGQVVRVISMATPTGNGTNPKVRMPPVKSRKYDIKHPATRAAPTATILRNADDPAPTQGMYRKYTPVSGWQGMSEQDKLNQ